MINLTNNAGYPVTFSYVINNTTNQYTLNNNSSISFSSPIYIYEMSCNENECIIEYDRTRNIDLNTRIMDGIPNISEIIVDETGSVFNADQLNIYNPPFNQSNLNRRSYVLIQGNATIINTINQYRGPYSDMGILITRN